MKNQELQSSLVKSGIILILTIFFIYAFAVGDSGGITGTFASLFSGILFLLGLTLALAVSVIVMFGIYFGILYMYDQDTCKKTYDEFKVKLAGPLQSLSSSCSSTKERVIPLQEEDLVPLRQNQDKLGNQLSNLQDSIKSLENSLSTVSSSLNATAEAISRLAEKATETDEALEGKATTASVDEASKKLGADITSLQTSVKPLSEKLAELETSLSSLDTEEDMTGQDLQEKVDSALIGIQEELTSMKQSIEELASQPQQEGNEAEASSHKILSYFTKKADEKKFIALVNKAVAQEMTYAETGEFLNDSLSTGASEVIADHPSLTKDYIRVCRQKN